MIVVDEAILALTGYQFPNPIDAFYAQRGADARDYYSRAYVKLAKPDAEHARAGRAAAPRRRRAAPRRDAEARDGDGSRRRRAADGRRRRRRRRRRRQADGRAEEDARRQQPASSRTAAPTTTRDRDPLELQPARGVLAGGEDRRATARRPSRSRCPTT